MNVLRLPIALFIYLLLSAQVLLAPDRAEAACCPCGPPCKITCTCCYGCNSDSASKEWLTATDSDTLASEGFGRSSLYPSEAKLNFTDKFQQLMRGSQCVRDKVILQLLGETDRRLKPDYVGFLNGIGMFR